MANEADLLQYRHIRNPALGFVTASAPTSTNPQFVAGSNIMTSYKGFLERRPGFDVGLETVPTTFGGPVKRIFSWRRWNDGFYIMLNAIVGSSSLVYKLNVGVDASFSLIFTSASSETFDFVVSNNFCFFGNGTDMKKFDGTTVYNWGIAIGNSNVTGPNTTGAGADVLWTGTAWTNPNNVTSGVSFATVNMTAALGFGAVSDYLQATTFGFSIPSTTTITGMTATFDIFSSGGSSQASEQVFVYLLKGGANAGTPKYPTIAQQNGGTGMPSSVTTYTLGGSSDLWGTTITSTDANQTTFGLAFVAQNYDLSATHTFSVRNVKITFYGVGGPAVAVSGSAGTFGATNGGYQYVYCYSSSTTGHISSPTAASAATGNFATKLNVGVTVVASTDPQVTNIRLFRTTDGGGGVYFEVANSPYANSSGTITDNTADASLSVVTAPTFGFNDPPSPQKGLVWFANRIWGFNNATVYFTDWEEMNIGVPEEASVSGSAGNFWNFDSEVTGLSVAQDGVLIFTAGSIYKIDGDSLDTFRRTVIAKGLGCRNRATIARLGGMTAFLANTNSIWTTDSTSLNEISALIQPTIDGIDHSQASMSFHIQGQYRWLVLCDAGHAQTLAYDVNTEKWMPPWSINGTAIQSGETSSGNWTLLLGQKTTNRMLQLVPNQYTDNGSTYTASMTLNPFPIIQEHMSNANELIDLYYPQAPGHVAYPEYVAADFNAVLPSDVLYMMDDDPATATYTSVVANITDAPLKAQGVNVLNKWYYVRKPTGRRFSAQMTWAAASTNFKLYTFTIAYRVYR